MRGVRGRDCVDKLCPQDVLIGCVVMHVLEV